MSSLSLAKKTEAIDCDALVPPPSVVKSDKRKRARTTTAAAAASSSSSAAAQEEEEEEEDPEETPASKEPRILITPSELKRILDFAKQSKAKDLLEAATKEFLPDVSKFKGKMFVSLCIDMRGGQVNTGFVISPEDWERVKKGTGNDAFHLGEVCGKHSDVSIPYYEALWEPVIERDPYAIARLVAERGEGGEGKPLWIEEYLETYKDEEEQ